jgi:SOS-response transcriptional repressor LexA
MNRQLITYNSLLPVQTNPATSDYLVVSNEEGEATFKQLKKYGKTRVLHPLNPKYDDIELNRDTEYRASRVSKTACSSSTTRACCMATDRK